MQIEPGIGGGKGSIGFGQMYYNSSGLDSGYMLKAAAMHTWGEPVFGVEPDQTYVGIEAELLALSSLSLSAGAYTHVGGSDDGSEWIFSGGIGYCF